MANLLKFVQNKNMSYHKLNTVDLKIFSEIVGLNNIFYSEEILLEYSHDETEDLNFLPEVVVKPTSSEADF